MFEVALRTGSNKCLFTITVKCSICILLLDKMTYNTSFCNKNLSNSQILTQNISVPILIVKYVHISQVIILINTYNINIGPTDIFIFIIATVVKNDDVIELNIAAMMIKRKHKTKNAGSETTALVFHVELLNTNASSHKFNGHTKNFN